MTSNKYHKCSECGLHYKDERIAANCEKWCRDNKSCNLEIIKHSIETQQGNKETKNA